MKKTIALVLIIWLACAGAAACAGETDFIFATPEPKAGAQEKAAEATAAPDTDAAPWTYPISREILDDPNDVLRLINRENLLDEAYPGKDKLVVTKVRGTSSTKWLVRDVVALPLEAMFNAAEAEGIKLYLESGHRDYATQKTIYYNRLKKNNGVDDFYAQFPGASEHQAGLGVDVLSKAWSDRSMNTEFAKTDEAQWMAANCVDFGFIIRYPDGKMDITGIRYEPWHLRYVGIEAASYITEKGLTLEEFTAEYKAALAGMGE